MHSAEQIVGKNLVLGLQKSERNVSCFCTSEICTVCSYFSMRIAIYRKLSFPREHIGMRPPTHPTLLEKQSRFPPYNMNCRGKHDTVQHELFRVVSRFPRYISCYIAESRLPLGQCTATVN